MLTSNQLQAIVTTLSPADAAAMLPNLTSAMDWAEINTAPRIGASSPSAPTRAPASRSSRRTTTTRLLACSRPYVTLTDLFSVDFVSNPDLLATPQYAFPSAAWYWKDRRINALADAKDIRNMTVAVNGGLNGYDARRAYYTQARRALGF